MTNEILDIVSDEDLVIGTMDKKSIYAKNLKNFRVVNAFIINSKKQLWIPTRHPSKRIFPLGLDFSIGGHVKSKETYYEAFVRESLEETNIDASKLPVQELGKLTPFIHHTGAFMFVYTILHDGPVHYNADDFIGFEWLFPKQIMELIHQGVPAKDDLKIVLQHFFKDK